MQDVNNNKKKTAVNLILYKQSSIFKIIYITNENFYLYICTKFAEINKNMDRETEFIEYCFKYCRLKCYKQMNKCLKLNSSQFEVYSAKKDAFKLNNQNKNTLFIFLI